MADVQAIYTVLLSTSKYSARDAALAAGGITDCGRCSAIRTGVSSGSIA